MNFHMSMCRAQMVQWHFNYIKKATKEIKSLEPRALYLLCYGHSLNPAGLKGVKIMSDVKDHTLEICILLKFTERM